LFANLAIVAKSYEERFAYAMLEELRDKNIDTLNRIFLNPLPEVKPSTNEIQMKLVEFHRKYNDPSSISVIYQAQKEVMKVKTQLNENMNKFLLANEDLEVYHLFK
jgi:beta-galactosidase beta subunit